MEWVNAIKKLIDDAVADRGISKSDLAEGLEDIEDHAEGWARQMREELENE